MPAPTTATCFGAPGPSARWCGRWRWVDMSAPASTVLLVAADASGRERAELEPFARDGDPALDADAEGAGCNAGQGGVDVAEGVQQPGAAAHRDGVRQGGRR